MSQLARMQPVRHRLVGPADHVANVVARARRDGTLVSARRIGTLADGRVRVDVIRWECPQPAQKAPAARGWLHGRRGPAVAAAAILAGCVTLLVGLGYAAVRTVQEATEHRGYVIGFVLLLLGAALLFCRRRGHVCTGLHCPGCRG